MRAADTVRGSHASANLYSLIETAKCNGVEPFAYLRHVFAVLPTPTVLEHVEARRPRNVDARHLQNAIRFTPTA